MTTKFLIKLKLTNCLNFVEIQDFPRPVSAVWIAADEPWMKKFQPTISRQEKAT